GHVRVVLVKDEASAEGKDKIGFEFVEGPVTPKPEKLPGARKRKPKSSGPNGGGGSKGPASRGPRVKVGATSYELKNAARRKNAGLLMDEIIAQPSPSSSWILRCS